MRSSVVKMKSAVLAVAVCAVFLTFTAGMVKRQVTNPCLKPGRIDTNLAIVWKRLNDPTRQNEVLDVLKCLVTEKNCTISGERAKWRLCSTVSNLPPGCYQGFEVCANECQKAINHGLSIPPFKEYWVKLKRKMATDRTWCRRN